MSSISKTDFDKNILSLYNFFAFPYVWTNQTLNNLNAYSKNM